jgi:hypothetical protein
VLSTPPRPRVRAEECGLDWREDQRELYLLEEQAGEEAPYERLLTDAMAGDGALIFCAGQALRKAPDFGSFRVNVFWRNRRAPSRRLIDSEGVFFGLFVRLFRIRNASGLDQDTERS